MELTVTSFGPLFGVVANAGRAIIQPALDVSASDFRAVVDTSPDRRIPDSTECGEEMADGGSVVFTSSSFARRGFNDWSSYNATKAGLSMLAQTLATE